MQNKHIKFCGLKFDGLVKKDLLTNEDRTTFVVTANAQIIDLAWRSEEYRAALRSGVLTFDGQVPYLLARLLNPHINFEKISGSDLVYDVIRQAAKDGSSIYFLGGSEQSNAQAVSRVRKEFGVTVAGAAPYVQADGACGDDVMAEISKINAKYVFVALGAPKQEFWINRNLEELNQLGVKLVIGVGGSIDFLSNKFTRAPVVVQKLCLEGVYRLWQDPTWERVRRLFVSVRLFRHVFR